MQVRHGARRRHRVAGSRVAGAWFEMITVTIYSPTADLSDIWHSLAERATPNAFMNPAALKAASETGFAKIHVLVAFDEASQPRRPVGLWALHERRLLPFLPAVLEGLPYYYAFLSSPVVDPDFAGETIAAFLDKIETAGSLPKVLRLKQFWADASLLGAMEGALVSRNDRKLYLARYSRPAASREVGVKKSGSTRKKLRQDWNRLSAAGEVRVENQRDGLKARDAFETFLTLEERSWKGETGTALLCNKRDAAFTRQWFAQLAADGSASVALLTIDGRPIAAQVLLYCGSTAYTWKTAFDAEFSKFSPGALLVDKVTEELFGESDICEIDSCSTVEGFMAGLWSGRRAVIDMLVAVDPHWSASFAIERFGEALRVRLMDLRDWIRGLQASPGKKAGVSPSA